jgi:hypothetical protein
MNYLTSTHNQIAITFCLITLFVTGCASKIPEFPPYLIVNNNLLEQSKNKIFKLGVVKADGNPYITTVSEPFRFEYKKKTLNKIPIEEICSLLSSKYSITIDTTVDKTAKIVKEGCGNNSGTLTFSTFGRNPQFFGGIKINAWWVDSAYYGNFKYDGESVCPQAINIDDFPDVVNVTYSFVYDVYTSKEMFYYDINVSSSGQDILKMHSIVEGKSMGQTDSFEERYSSYDDHAGGISKALKRDLFTTADMTTVVY